LNSTKINQLSVVLPDPDPDVVSYIEALLEEAKTGEIQSIVVAVSLSNHRTGSSWAGMNKNNMAVLGEIEVLKRDLMDLLISLRVEPGESA